MHPIKAIIFLLMVFLFEGCQENKNISWKSPYKESVGKCYKTSADMMVIVMTDQHRSYLETLDWQLWVFDSKTKSVPERIKDNPLLMPMTEGDRLITIVPKGTVVQLQEIYYVSTIFSGSYIECYGRIYSDDPRFHELKVSMSRPFVRGEGINQHLVTPSKEVFEEIPCPEYARWNMWQKLNSRLPWQWIIYAVIFFWILYPSKKNTRPLRWKLATFFLFTALIVNDFQPQNFSWKSAYRPHIGSCMQTSIDMVLLKGGYYKELTLTPLKDQLLWKTYWNSGPRTYYIDIPESIKEKPSAVILDENRLTKIVAIIPKGTLVKLENVSLITKYFMGNHIKCYGNIYNSTLPNEPIDISDLYLKTVIDRTFSETHFAAPAPCLSPWNPLQKLTHLLPWNYLLIATLFSLILFLTNRRPKP